MIGFYAYLSRMKHIKRWGLMRNTETENIKEHSLDVAVIAHALALIGNTYFGKNHDAEHIMALAVFHETGEVITGALATPIKYFNPGVKDAFKAIERIASEKLLSYLPEDLREDYEPWLLPDENSPEWKLVKAADRISAYLKCIEEEKMGNRDFAYAKTSVLQSITMIDLPEVQAFMAEFVASFSLSPDELSR